MQLYEGGHYKGGGGGGYHQVRQLELVPVCVNCITHKGGHHQLGHVWCVINVYLFVLVNPSATWPETSGFWLFVFKVVKLSSYHHLQLWLYTYINSNMYIYIYLNFINK